MSGHDPEDPRTLGALAIGDELRRVLTELRRRQQVSAKAEVDADRLHGVETAVGYRFADDLLATYAAGVPLLSEEFHFTLDSVVAHTGALGAAGARGDLIGLGRRGDEFLCLAKRDVSSGETNLLRRRPRQAEDEPIPLLFWLEDLLAGLPASDAEGAEFAPQIVRAPPAGSSGRRVRHPVFGEGRVYLEIGTGPERKVKVDFPGKGLTLLQARFLEFLDE